jgi:hypothetical protein
VALLRWQWVEAGAADWEMGGMEEAQLSEWGHCTESRRVIQSPPQRTSWRRRTEARQVVTEEQPPVRSCRCGEGAECEFSFTLGAPGRQRGKVPKAPVTWERNAEGSSGGWRPG